jgi:hypothetical protein
MNMSEFRDNLLMQTEISIESHRSVSHQYVLLDVVYRLTTSSHILVPHLHAHKLVRLV